MKNIFRSRAPLRLGLAGGGTDISPFSDNYGGFVLNSTIDLYAQSILEPLDNDRIIFVAEDLQETANLESSLYLDYKGPLKLHCAIYNRIVKQFNIKQPLSFKLTTFADVPPGSGLGTSSTLVVSIIKIFSEWLNLVIGKSELANLAFEIERKDLKLAGGKQDHYAASFGGFNFIEFGPGSDRVKVNALNIKDWIRNELESSTVLFYTGQSRESARIIEDQIEGIKKKSSIPLLAMQELKKDALEMKEAILQGDFNSYGMILDRSWKTKKKLSISTSSLELDSLYNLAIQAGALSGKISGAGGGGFFMFLVSADKRMNLIRELEKQKGRVINFHFTPSGAESWRQIKTF